MLPRLTFSISLLMFAVLSTPGESLAQATTIEVVSDLSYKPEAATDYERERCKLDLYLPAERSGFATIVWFHGGGLQNGNKDGEHEVALAKRFVSEGLAVASVNYRLSPKAKFPAYVDDAAAAVAYVYKNIGDHGGSQKHVFVSGHSAGGYLTAMVGIDDTWLKKYDVSDSAIAGFMPIAGQMVTHSTIRGERGLPKTAIVIDEAAPAFHVRKDARPFLLFAGSHDLPMRAEENALFTSAMKAAGHRATEYYLVDGRDHGSIAHMIPQKDDLVAQTMLEFMRSIGQERH